MIASPISQSSKLKKKKSWQKNAIGKEIKIITLEQLHPNNVIFSHLQSTRAIPNIYIYYKYVHIYLILI